VLGLSAEVSRTTDINFIHKLAFNNIINSFPERVNHTALIFFPQRKDESFIVDVSETVQFKVKLDVLLYVFFVLLYSWLYKFRVLIARIRRSTTAAYSHRCV
jgi:hypothetical protein